MNRRRFLSTTLLSSLSIGISPSLIACSSGLTKKLTLGLIADLHVDLIPDAVERLKAFLEASGMKDVNALIQLGDFAIPAESNQGVIDLFNSFHSYTYHVLGNHDTDGGYSWEACLKAYGMQSRYYAFDLEGVRVLVLDGNEKGSPSYTGGYPCYIGSVQKAWMEEELEKAKIPILILSHQPLAGTGCIDNSGEIQALLGNYADKILLALNGHSHVDDHLTVQGVHFVHINSASYYWVGRDYVHLSYPEAIHADYPHLSKTCPYSDPLFAFLTIDWEKGVLQLEGRNSNWRGPSPQELGYVLPDIPAEQELLIPAIRSREIIRE